MDVNYVKYGADAVNATYAVEPFSSFLATNGYAIGAILAIIIVLFIVGLIIVFGLKSMKRLIP